MSRRRIGVNSQTAAADAGKVRPVGWQAFVASLVQSLAWPVGVVAVVVVLHKPIAVVLSQGVMPHVLGDFGRCRQHLVGGEYRVVDIAAPDVF